MNAIAAGESIAEFLKPIMSMSLKRNLPDRCVLDGEIVIAGPNGLDFDALSQRIHPAESRLQSASRTTALKGLAHPSELLVPGLKALGIGSSC